jgi:hypothetical protein
VSRSRLEKNGPAGVVGKGLTSRRVKLKDFVPNEAVEKLLCAKSRRGTDR